MNDVTVILSVSVPGADWNISGSECPPRRWTLAIGPIRSTSGSEGPGINRPCVSPISWSGAARPYTLGLMSGKISSAFAHLCGSRIAVARSNCGFQNGETPEIRDLESGIWHRESGCGSAALGNV